MKNKKPTTTQGFFEWSLNFTKKLILIITLVWIAYMTYSAAMILFAIIKIGDFSYLDTFMVQNSETFRLIVGTNLVTHTVESVFRYNESAFFGKSLPYGDTNTNTEDHP